MGDLNSRIAEKDDYLIEDNYNPLQQNSEWIKRTSMDKTTNSSGGTFIDMIIAEELQSSTLVSTMTRSTSSLLKQSIQRLRR